MAAAARPRRAGRGGQLVRQRAEDLHHVGSRQVPLRHRPHRAVEVRGRSLRRPRRPLDVPGEGVRGSARRHAPPLRHAGARRGEARAPRVRDRGALLRSRPGRAHRQAGRGLQVHAGAHEQRARRRGVREHRPRRGRLPPGPSLRGGAALDGQAHRPARDDRRLPRRDADGHPGPARARRDGLLPRGDGAEARAPRAVLGRGHAAREGSARPRPARAPRARPAPHAPAQVPRRREGGGDHAAQPADPRRRGLHAASTRRRSCSATPWSCPSTRARARSSP